MNRETTRTRRQIIERIEFDGLTMIGQILDDANAPAVRHLPAGLPPLPALSFRGAQPCGGSVNHFPGERHAATRGRMGQSGLLHDWTLGCSARAEQTEQWATAS